ncbi:CobW family GTP-binding protein [Methylopila musalis]|uniref:CobW family GTP-binding protein n=1 Tax=Methylopila musalis TaxID=1134781 RepID=A0ABW3Z2K6_9HYPH
MTDPRRPEPLPLVLLTGFLGAGKTTLLNRLLRDPALSGAAVLVNELGEIGVDHLLVEHAEEGVIALAGGCLCCGVRGELVDALENLLRARDNGRLPPFDRLVIETTGLADPAPALQTLMLHPYLALRFHIAAVVTVVDASDAGATLATSPEAARQVAMADRIALSKTDVATPDQIAAARAGVARLAPTAEVIDAQGADAAALIAPVEGPRRGLDAAPLGHGAVRSVSMESEAPLTRAAYDLFVELLRSAHAAKVLRLKGLIRLVEEPDRPLLVQGVRHVFAPPRFLDAWPDEDRRTRLVAIGENLDPGLLAGLYAAFAGQVAPDRADRAALVASPLTPSSGGLLG